MWRSGVNEALHRGSPVQGQGPVWTMVEMEIWSGRGKTDYVCIVVPRCSSYHTTALQAEGPGLEPQRTYALGAPHWAVCCKHNNFHTVETIKFKFICGFIV